MDDWRGALARIFAAEPFRLIFSKPAQPQAACRKLMAEKKQAGFQLSRYTATQVFHENLAPEALEAACMALEGQFLQLNAWSEGFEHRVLVSRKGACSYKRVACQAQAAAPQHNREKRYLIAEGADVPPLVDMGVFTKDGGVVRSMYDKFRQINRFLELLDDALRGQLPEKLNVIDFGCGKSYLTFVVYYYLTVLRGVRARIVGLDLKADVIEKCNAAARKYGYDGLRFELGDIGAWQAPFRVDLVMTLHACDTATDYALYNAIRWNARMIFSVPCCQHELNGQMQPGTLPILSRYGIVRERFSALATDAIRANLLQYCGYRTQLLEFIDLSHTSKNLLLRAVRKEVLPRAVREQALREVEALMREFSFSPALYRLLLEKQEARPGRRDADEGQTCD